MPANIRVNDGLGHVSIFDEADARAFLARTPGAFVVERPAHPEEGSRFYQEPAPPVEEPSGPPALAPSGPQDGESAGSPTSADSDKAPPAVQEPQEPPAAQIVPNDTGDTPEAAPAAPEPPSRAEKPAGPAHKGPGRPRK